MKRMISLALILCLMLSGAAIFTGCSADGGKDWPVTIGDVTIDKEPENIVVLNDTLADIISYIGYDVKMVGRSEECDQDFLHVVPTVGSAAVPDVTAITNAQADLVIADSTLPGEAKISIEAAGVKVVTFVLPATEDELEKLYIDLGTVLGGNTTGMEKGEKGYTGLLDMLGTLNTATSNVVQTAAYLYMDGSGQLCTFVKDSLEFKFFNYNGNSNVFANQAEPLVNAQELRIGSPNYIFYDSEEVLAYLAADEQFVNLNALKDNRTYQIPRKSFERYGTSAEQAVFEMLNFIDKESKSTPDEATVADATAAEETAAPAAATQAAEPETTAEAVEEAAQDSDVIAYSVQNNEIE